MTARFPTPGQERLLQRSRTTSFKGTLPQWLLQRDMTGSAPAK